MFNKISAHDCYSSYFKYESIRHDLCNDHILRELQSVTDNQKQMWAEKQSRLFLDMNDARDSDVAKGLIYHRIDQLDAVNRIYDIILDAAKKENSLQEPDELGRMVKNGKIAALIKRLVKHKGAICIFYEDYTVPRSNNKAERDFHVFKVKLKVCGGFRTFAGGEDFACMMSYLR